METKDKIAQLGHSAPGIDSLKIPSYQWWSEALHGVAGSPGVHFGGNVRGKVSCMQHVFHMFHCYVCRHQLPLPSHKLLDLVQHSTCMYIGIAKPAWGCLVSLQQKLPCVPKDVLMKHRNVLDLSRKVLGAW